MKADALDTAAELEEMDRQDAMRRRRPAGPPPKGECFYCDATLGSLTARWCDSECRDGWTQEQERLRANGG